ncbi:MAG: methylthioribulose 1-phosphate dehydratase [Alicyclobacillaceae bacterium]|nr:methylthioribulose 1-phosphate dehydratase [Alicyclobacillaceae bacterium]
MTEHLDPRTAVVSLAAELAAKGWLPATSGNLSVKVQSAPLVMAITRSGADKQHLRADDVLHVRADLTLAEPSPFRPSAETVVHVRLYERIGCGCVLHVHTVFNNLVSQLYWAAGGVPLAGHELLKALDHWERDARVTVPIVDNFHDLQQLADAVAEAARPDVPGVLVRSHGIYAWGQGAADAKRYLEAFEFLFEYVVRYRGLTGLDSGGML